MEDRAIIDVAAPQAGHVAHCSLMCDPRSACRSRSAWLCLGMLCAVSGNSGADLVTSVAVAANSNLMVTLSTPGRSLTVQERVDGAQGGASGRPCAFLPSYLHGWPEYSPSHLSHCAHRIEPFKRAAVHAAHLPIARYTPSEISVHGQPAPFHATLSFIVNERDGIQLDSDEPADRSCSCFGLYLRDCLH